MCLIYDYMINNTNIILCGLGVSTVCFLGLSVIGSYYSTTKVDKGIQTDAWEDYSERASQIASEGGSSIDTITPRISPIEYVKTGGQTLVDSTSNINTATTVLPIPPIDIPFIPNPDIWNSTLSSAMVDGNRFQQISEILTLFGS